MKYTIGIPKEIKTNELRVSLIPDDVKKLTNLNIEVFIEKNAGIGANFDDNDYILAGAIICETPKEVFDKSIIIVKVKELLEEEYDYINENHIILTFFHFAGIPSLINAMIDKSPICIAYETIRKNDGTFPILAPMSIIAGEQAILNAVNFFKDDYKNFMVLIIGVGNVGKASAYKAKEMGFSNINLIDKDYEKLKKYENDGFNIFEMTNINLIELLKKSNIIIGSIYNNGEKAQKLIINDLLVIMPNDSVFMDVAIDQGGMTEKSKPTTADDPYIKYHNTHIYCVPNIPSLVPHEASIKLSNVICPYVRTLAQEKTNDELESAINLKKGEIIHSSLRLLLLPLMLHI